MIAIERRWLPGLVALVLANLAPLVGVLAFGWHLGLLLLLYWSESAVIFAFSIAKGIRIWKWRSLAFVPFFCIHAGMFMGGHLVFLLAVFVTEPAQGWMWLARQAAWGTLAFVASHLVSFLANAVFGDEAPREGKGAVDPMAGFYKRVVVMHLTIIGGAFLMVPFGSPTWALVLFIALKTAADAAAHLRELRKAQPAPELDEASRLDIERARRDMQGNP
jgi:hypothetical protein